MIISNEMKSYDIYGIRKEKFRELFQAIHPELNKVGRNVSWMGGSILSIEFKLYAYISSQKYLHSKLLPNICSRILSEIDSICFPFIIRRSRKYPNK